MAATAEQQELTEVLLDHLRKTGFPSAVELDRIERLISSREQLEQYMSILMEKVESAKFSGQLLDRLERLLRVLRRVDQEESG